MPGSKKPTKTNIELDRIKSSVAERSFSLFKLGLSAGAGIAGRGIAQLWENKELSEGRWKDFLTAQAKNFTSEAGELKGSLMKAGQMLSMMGEHFFPPEVNQFLKSLQHESPPVKWAAIEEILIKELGPEKLAELEIEHTALASASLGQVHKARVKATGRWIALKVQYPGIEKAIDSDIKALKTFLNLMKVLPKNFNTAPLFEEVRKMMIQETNYILEAELTERYAAGLKNDSRYVVPQVIREFSNKHILATSFEEGVRPDDPSVESLSQERRNRLAENFLDLYFRELYDWRLVQTDPHAGNYRVRLAEDGQDQWVLLDFGASREFPASFVEPYRHMNAAAMRNDRAAFRKAAVELNFLQESDDPELIKKFEDFCFMILEPFRGGVFDWKKTDLPQRTTKSALEIIRGFSWRTPPSEIVFLDRKTGGVFIMMNLLRAKFDGRGILLAHLAER